MRGTSISIRIRTCNHSGIEIVDSIVVETICVIIIVRVIIAIVVIVIIVVKIWNISISVKDRMMHMRSAFTVRI